MKLSILTFHYADNYGAVFQAYALQTYLKSLGHQVEILDYRSDDILRGGRLRLHPSARDIKADLYKLYIKWLNMRRGSVQGDAGNAFDAFRRKFLAISLRRHCSFAELQYDPPHCDAYVCGSDQIWNPPFHVGVDPAYFLDFAPEGRRRVSYAASFGRNDIEPEYHPQMARLLGKMDALSVREKNGVDLVTSLTGRPAMWLPDPTLLLDNYAAITTPPAQDGYLFTYILREREWVEKANRVVADHLHAPVVDPHAT
ncbi:MAG: polysaccharide pyruvyl transferase family protein, partial [Planctomycetota bacterium]|nr:polysaccharide pyruvyl transferase family protein [Planctomycetota bacterium]